MECFIIEDGTERKAALEDLLPLIKEGPVLQFYLREANRSKIELAAALAYLSDEMKELVYRNMSAITGGSLKELVNDLEARFEKNNSLLREARIDLIELLGELEKEKIWESLFARPIIWKETDAKLAAFIKLIEEALDSGELKMAFCTNDITQEDIQNAFQNYLDGLPKIRCLIIKGKDLPAAALLFETAKIEELYISGEADVEWPSFLEKCQSLTKLSLSYKGSEFPSWVHNASSLRNLSIKDSKIMALPDWIGDLQSLTWLSLYDNENLETLPHSIGNLKNLFYLDIKVSLIKTLPDSIGDLQSLTNLSLYNNGSLETLPDSIGNLNNLVRLHINNSPIKTLPDSMGNLRNLQHLILTGSLIEKIPDWIGSLQSLTLLLLFDNGNLKTLSDSVGNLKNLTRLSLGDSPIEKLPDTIVNCTALESVDIFGTEISSVPDFISSLAGFIGNTLLEVIPSPSSWQGQSISYTCFCNSYYRLVKTILRFNAKARREGLLALAEEEAYLAEGFFRQGIMLVVNGHGAEIIRHILTIKLEREHNFYRRKLMEVAMEGILSIQAGDSPSVTVFLLASRVNIKNNPLDAACAKYLTGDIEAISNIDFEAALLPEEEREEISFIKRAMGLSEIVRREGLLGLEERLDHEGIAQRDVFEYGLVFVIDGWDADLIRKILDNLIEHETDPVRKNIAQAKKEAVLSIAVGDNPRILCEKICAYFDEGIAGEIRRIVRE